MYNAKGQVGLSMLPNESVQLVSFGKSALWAAVGSDRFARKKHGEETSYFCAPFPSSDCTLSSIVRRGAGCFQFASQPSVVTVRRKLREEELTGIRRVG